ncbi:MAG TPA: penicillin-binding transpeptidase domain-containing protein, partial [Candidatus Baltobacteraceae bacterium]|nr:penicillin-binding transpeptidase domain-containing protein [Candidatus Baltobacteraceae bacterium]
YTVRAKTGWAQEQQAGWFVGYVEPRGRPWFFATNLEIIHPEDNRLRPEITLEALKVKGII